MAGGICQTQVAMNRQCQPTGGYNAGIRQMANSNEERIVACRF